MELTWQSVTKKKIWNFAHAATAAAAEKGCAVNAYSIILRIMNFLDAVFQNKQKRHMTGALQSS